MMKGMNLSEVEESLQTMWDKVSKRAADMEDEGDKMKQILMMLAVISELDNSWHVLAAEEEKGDPSGGQKGGEMNELRTGG